MIINITYFFRKPRPGAFSIENLFLNVQKEFGDSVSVTNHFLSKPSTGILNRLLLSIEAFRSQNGINHITGDINFIAAFLNKKKTVLTIHDIESFKRKNSILNFLINYFWVNMPIKKAARVTVVSHETKKKLLEKVNVDSEKIVVIPNIISQDFTYFPKDFNKQKPKILQIGTKYNKNLERTIIAIKGIPCTFIIVGSLSPKQLNLLAANKIEYENKVGISNEELRATYREADIVTFVSTFEGFGLPILEANAIGRPVVTSNCSSMPEVAGNGALLVDPFNTDEIREAYLNIIRDDKLRNSLINEGLENTKRFLPKEVAQMYLKVYQSLNS